MKESKHSPSNPSATLQRPSSSISSEQRDAIRHRHRHRHIHNQDQPSFFFFFFFFCYYLKECLRQRPSTQWSSSKRVSPPFPFILLFPFPFFFFFFFSSFPRDDKTKTQKYHSNRATQQHSLFCLLLNSFFFILFSLLSLSHYSLLSLLLSFSLFSFHSFLSFSFSLSFFLSPSFLSFFLLHPCPSTNSLSLSLLLLLTHPYSYSHSHSYFHFITHSLSFLHTTTATTSTKATKTTWSDTPYLKKQTIIAHFFLFSSSAFFFSLLLFSLSFTYLLFSSSFFPSLRLIRTHHRSPYCLSPSACLFPFSLICLALSLRPYKNKQTKKKPLTLHHQSHPLLPMQHYQSYPADTTYALAMDPHYQNNNPSNNYSPVPAQMGPRSTPHHTLPHTSHARTHSRSNSGAFPPHNQGPFPPQQPPQMQQQQPQLIDAPMGYQGNHPNQARPYTSGPQGMNGYGSPPPPTYNTAPQDPHLHQRAPHHPHPYHAPAPPMTHSRTHSRSHSRSQSHSQQFASYPSIQSPPPQPSVALRHGSPAAPVSHPHSRYGQEGYMDSQVDPVRFPMQVPQPPVPRHMMEEQMHPQQPQHQQLDREMSHGPMGPQVQEPLARSTPAPAPAPVSTPVPASAPAPMASAAEEEASDASKCPDCGKVYKHAASLLKHRWEHSVYWKPAAKFLLSKHQQVQLMEAAAILLGMDESRQSDKDPIVRMMSRQRGQSAAGTAISSVSPATSTKSLSASPPPMAERALSLKQETAGMMSPPAFVGRASNTTRHSVTSTTSTASSLSSTPPSLAPDDNESVIEAEDDMMSMPPSLRQPHQQHMQQHHHQQQQQHHHHIQQQQPHGLPHHQHHGQQQLQQHPHQQPPMVMDMDMRQKHSEPQYYQHDSRYPAYHQQQPPQQHAEPYAPYYHH